MDPGYISGYNPFSWMKKKAFAFTGMIPSRNEIEALFCYRIHFIRMLELAKPGLEEGNRTRLRRFSTEYFIRRTVPGVPFAGTFNIPTSYQQGVWKTEAHIKWSMVTCQGSTRLALP